MDEQVRDVLEDRKRWAVVQDDVLNFLRSLPPDSVDLVLGSPPYEAQRTYGIDFDKRGEDWVAWMVDVFRWATLACKGLVCMVVEGFTKDYCWSATPALLLADLHRAGFCLRKPPAYCRVGIPGSGGPDWLRNDWEWCVCISWSGQLPWSDNKAMGHPPKWAPGGEMSHRLSNGSRVNEWGGSGKNTFRMPDGTLVRQSGRASQLGVKKGAVCGHKNGDTAQEGIYEPPTIANPGNLIRCTAGGGQMGSALCHENEAPFPEKLAEFFIRSFCPPDGLCVDPFAGSGTTLAVALQWQRRALGCDIRQSQVDLTTRRVSGVTPTLFPEGK